jgi:hypothetical protein
MDLNINSCALFGNKLTFLDLHFNIFYKVFRVHENVYLQDECSYLLNMLVGFTVAFIHGLKHKLQYIKSPQIHSFLFLHKLPPC